MSILQPLEDLSANIVTLVFNIYNFEHLDGSYTSDLKEHNGIYWCVRIQSNKAAKSQKRRVSIYLVCNPNNSSPDWSVTTSFGFRIINSWGKSRNKISTLFNHTFTSNETSKGTSGYCTWDELTAANSGFLVEGRFQIEFDLNVNSSTGIRKEKISKEKYEKYIADGELITDGKTVKVCLALLADNSPILYNLFYVEKPGQTTFHIFDFTYEAILGMVSILQLDSFEVSVYNYRDLLELGQRYQIPSVTDKCEEFLLKTRYVSIETKLKLSEIFELHYLQFRTLERVTCIHHIDNILDDHMDIGEKTYDALLEKMKHLKTQEDGQLCSCKRNHVR
ncbi:BTB and MATH domain-containing protein 39 [Caenorhabditis elegans]|uniref:BTB and MATH domain-containing protein 39 n=1 Tax=Caenorhabditis elegans TaxID=6239 RepID=BAT39_CAEEL|nr:BTB and MATH domain-containing protein 39 [Caenorhabditis elegans]P90846.3 RecName: Full=BTB and MATH domain-containing protein 39 [Caenorhabditis elegans]CAB02991.2 BTB and MATH domain-containing protein 39 [Caenorhabditis elegans]|eukprot:NP_506339.2 BTB and MATH domain-containing protein 39 [Caenorhabditis elegans]